jgi:hypothetical protein
MRSVVASLPTRETPGICRSAADARPITTTPTAAVTAISNTVWISVLGVILPFPSVNRRLMKRIQTAMELTCSNIIGDPTTIGSRDREPNDLSAFFRETGGL